MSIYRRGDCYYIKIQIPGGRVIRHSARTRDRRQAQEYHDKLKARLWEEARLGIKPQHSWDEAALKWLQEKRHKATYREDVRYIRWFTQHLRGVVLDEITRERVDELISNIPNVSDRTRDLHVAVIRGIMRRAMREWGWIDQVPAFRTYTRGGRHRVRWLSRSVVMRLLDELPEHQRALVLFSLATGLRMSNVLTLTWEQVDWEHSVARIEQTKNDAPLTVPLNNMALLVLDRQVGRHPTWVFTYKGRPLKRSNTRAWRAALQRAGIDDFRWHDLRHTWASWLRQEGVPTWALRELAGWKTAAMADRYAHVNVAHLAPHVSKLDTVLDTPLVAGLLPPGGKRLKNQGKVVSPAGIEPATL